MAEETKFAEIVIRIPVSKQGKFRFKTRTSNFDFGNTFATRQKVIAKDLYLEWQIGYDALVIDVQKGKKFTELKEQTFVGANGKSKYLYELSELVFHALQKELILIKDLQNLLNEVSAYKAFIDDKKIEIEKNGVIILNGVNFHETSIKLPTFFMVETADGTQVEVSVQKQQYASGVQPMVYFCIPISSFRNYENILGRPSKIGDELLYVIDKKNVRVLFDMLKIFGMSSKRHNFDIIEILKILIKSQAK